MKTELIKHIWETILVRVTPDHMPTKNSAKSYCKNKRNKLTLFNVY